MRLPGLIDVHVHLRDPGATLKEDFETGTRAAAAGGFTYVIDMPNNPIPTITIGRLKEKITLVQKKAVVEVDFHYGTNGKNISSFGQAIKYQRVRGLKLYCNHTTGEMLIEDLALLERVFEAWKSDKPILVHAEGVQLAAALALAHFYERHLHVCHISQAIEVELVRRAKRKKQRVTAGVCPHHLWLTEKDVKKLGSRAMMKPPLGTKQDQEALWEGLKRGVIDVVETDHAPHTLAEKGSKIPPFGVPGLETAVGLLWLGVKKKRCTKDEVIEWVYEKPKKIFNVPTQGNTYVELDPGKEWTVEEPQLETKCGWSPFAGWDLFGKPETVVLRGKVLVAEGRLITYSGGRL